MATQGSAGWVVVLPVKGGEHAKSRLAHGPELAAAMAADCLDAVLSASAVRRVLVVTSDVTTAREASAAGAEVVDQPTSQPGLGPAVRAGLRAVGEQGAADEGPVAVLLADLPALRPEHLDRALSHLGEVLARGAVSAFVPDLDDEGTVLLAGRTAADLTPRFGTSSAAAHELSGAVRVALDLPGLRRDVDTPENLAEALALGVGQRTTRTLDAMQATVIRYDPDAGTGEVVTDDGIRLPMASGATAGSGLRHLRPGQRVSCEAVDADGAPAGDTSGAENPDHTSPVAVTRVRLRGIGD